MIWNIFKKDWKLLWPYAALFAAVQIAAAVNLAFRSGANRSGAFNNAADVIPVVPVAIVIGGAYLIGLIAQQDAIPGVRQDWLVRPIRRRDLLLAKILSVVLLIHIPMLAGDLLYGAAYHFPLGQLLEFAVSRNVFILLGLSLPLLAFFSLTKNLKEAIAAALAIAGVSFLVLMFSDVYHWQVNWIYRIAQETGFEWVSQSAANLVLLVGTASILMLQYFRRRTLASRFVTGIVWIGYVLVLFFLPWKAAFAIGEKFSSDSGMGERVDVSFDPSGARYKLMPPTQSEIPPEMYLPVRISGLPSDAYLRADLYFTRAVFASGESRDLSLDQKADFSANGPGYLKLEFAPLYALAREEAMNDPRVKTQPMQLEIQLWMTLFKPVDSSGMHSMGAPMKINGTDCILSSNYVSTSWDDTSEMEVQLGCTPVPKPYCYTAVFQNPPAPYVNRPSMNCSGDYGPFAGRLLPGGSSISTVTYLRDPAGVVRYPSGSKDLFKSKITLTSYRPVDHFTRKIVIPGIRHSEWTAEIVPAN